MAETVTKAANYKQVLARYERLPKDIRGWLDATPELIGRYDWKVSIAFVFMKIEEISHLTLYKGLVKRHRTDASLTRQILDKEHFTRPRFRELFKVIFGLEISKEATDKLKDAEKIRDRAIHEKRVTDADARSCLMSAFDFIEIFCAFVEDIAKFRPCGDGRGFKGRAEALSKETSQWVLKGMGIIVAKKRGVDVAIDEEMMAAA